MTNRRSSIKLIIHFDDGSKTRALYICAVGESVADGFKRLVQVMDAKTEAIVFMNQNTHKPIIVKYHSIKRIEVR